MEAASTGIRLVLAQYNTTFFHSVATTRKRVNQILQIQDENRVLVSNEALIRGVFV